MKALLVLAFAGAMPAAAETYRLTPEAAAAARTEGETRAFETLAAHDAAAAEKLRARRMLGFGVGIGTGVTPQGFAPLGDIGQSDFVYTPGSIGQRRYKY